MQGRRVEAASERGGVGSLPDSAQVVAVTGGSGFIGSGQAQISGPEAVRLRAGDRGPEVAAA